MSDTYESIDWEEVPLNPDLEDDLGYDLSDLEVIWTDNSDEHVLILPWDEEMLAENIFIVADPDSVVDVAEYR